MVAKSIDKAMFSVFEPVLRNNNINSYLVYVKPAMHHTTAAVPALSQASKYVIGGASRPYSEFPLNDHNISYYIPPMAFGIVTAKTILKPV